MSYGFTFFEMHFKNVKLLKTKQADMHYTALLDSIIMRNDVHSIQNTFTGKDERIYTDYGLQNLIIQMHKLIIIHIYVYIYTYVCMHV